MYALQPAVKFATALAHCCSTHDVQIGSPEPARHPRPLLLPPLPLAPPLLPGPWDKLSEVAPPQA
jgi:hypothetical protein